MQQREALILGALLHDIGKLVQRADDQPSRMTHQEFGAEWLRRNGVAELVASIVERHHLLKSSDPKYEDLDAGISNSTLIVCQADWLSARERPEKERSSDEKGQWRADIPLLSLFSKIHLLSNDTKPGYMEPLWIGCQIPYPKDEVTLSKESYEGCLRALEADFEYISRSLTLDNLLVLLEKHLSFIPSETRMVKEKIESHPDISLFDHLKTTAAIANVIDLYLAENYPRKYERNESLREEIQKDDDPKFLLIGGDFSGVQKFIYTISSKGALKTLRARSFFLEMLTEHITAEILEKLSLTRANLVYSGGGRFYILAANTESAKEELDILQDGINKWFLTEFGGKLFLAIGSFAFCGRDLRSDRISEIWGSLGLKTAESKGCRFKGQLKEILTPSEPKLPFDACSVCHRDDIEEGLKPLREGESENRACPFCISLYNFGDELINAKFIGKTEDKSIAGKYPIRMKKADGVALYYTALKERAKGFDSLWVINSWELSDYEAPNSIPLLVGNYVRKVEDLPEHARESEALSSTASFEELARVSRGTDRIGVLRMDMDNLGMMFTRGFKKELRTFSRLASLSRQLTLFFKFYINSVCKGELGVGLKPLDLSEKSLGNNKGRNLSIVYSGGDDLFLVGAWDEVVEVGFDIQSSFKGYTCRNRDINISGGVVVQRENYPIYLLAELAGEAEKLSKDEGRDRITLFYNPAIREVRSGAQNSVKQTFDWKKVDVEVLGFVEAFKALGKIDKEKNHFRPGFAHSFIYKLFSIYEEWERRGVIYLPKMGYVYKRLQEKLSKEKETPELARLRAILMDEKRIMDLRTSLIWIELLSRSEKKEV